MLRKTLTYTEFVFPDDGGDPVEEERTDTFYFFLTEAEIIEINLMVDIEAVYKSKDSNAIVPAFHKLVSNAVAYREGNRPMKSPKFSQQFMSSGAYSALFMEILQSDSPEKMSAEFIKGVMPAKFTNKVEDEAKMAEARELLTKPAGARFAE